jgi:hypothetical protein
MSSDQIAEIRPAIREGIDGAPDTCVTLEVEGHSDKWLQFVGHTINAAYPHMEDPKEMLKSLSALSAPKIVSWETGKFVTLDFEKVELTPLAKWIDEYFRTCSRLCLRRIPRRCLHP